MNRKALVLVDIQNDFLPGGSLAVPNGDQVIPVANSIIGRIGSNSDWAIITTQDYHPEGHVSFASSYPNGKPFTRIGSQDLWPDHCVKGTDGAKVAAGLNVPTGCEVLSVLKGTHKDVDSYSAFMDANGKADFNLQSWFWDHNITDLYFMGLATDYCVKACVLDAVKLCGPQIRVSVVVDGCRGVNVNPTDVDKALDEMCIAGANIIRSLQVPIGKNN